MLVAGGLGERLGYNGIKVAIPCEVTTNTSFLELYIQQILALQVSCECTRIYIHCIENVRRSQRLCGDEVAIPFVIMTSDDTHAGTVALLTDNAYFGMNADQVHEMGL